jgi:hypothetical protein
LFLGDARGRGSTDWCSGRPPGSSAHRRQLSQPYTYRSDWGLGRSSTHIWSMWWSMASPHASAAWAWDRCSWIQPGDRRQSTAWRASFWETFHPGLQHVQQPSRLATVMPACSSSGPPPLTAAYRGCPDTSQLARREFTSQGQGSPDSHLPMPSSHRILFISRRILFIAQRIAAGLGLYVFGTEPQPRHVRPSWASDRSSWTSAARSCRLWRPTCAAAGHHEWTAGACAALCPSPCFVRRRSALHSSVSNRHPSTDGHSAFPHQSTTFPYRPSCSHGGITFPSLPWTVMIPPPCQRTPLSGHSSGQLCMECPPTSSSPSSAGSILTQTLTPSRSRQLYSASTRSCKCASRRAVASHLLQYHHRRQHTPLVASRLLSLNVNGLHGKDKRRPLFNLLHRDQCLAARHTIGQPWPYRGGLAGL